LPVSAVTPSGTQRAFGNTSTEGEILLPADFVLPWTEALYAATHNAETFVVHAVGAHL